MKAIDKLLEISSGGLQKTLPDPSDFPCDSLAGIQLKSLLMARNGFLAFEGALLVLPKTRAGDIPGIDDWNDPMGWRQNYDTIPAGCIFFSMDAFACQFGISPSGVIRFDPETGEVSGHSENLEEWAAKVLDNYDYETGWSAAKEWQRQNGPLPLGSRLLGRKPFVLGGDFVANNLVCVNLDSAIEKLAALYTQLRNIPDGTKIAVRGWL